MVSFANNEGFGVCLSSDTKPTDGVRNGDLLMELDASKIWFFDEENAEWKEWGAESE